MPLVFTIAFRNLFHDRLRFVATVIGIVFSIVLVTIQMGLYFGFGRMALNGCKEPRTFGKVGASVSR